MSRKHAPPPVSDLTRVKQAIRRRLNELLAAGQKPVAIECGAGLWEALRESAGGRWDLSPPEMFRVRCERVGEGDGWAIRCAPQTQTPPA